MVVTTVVAVMKAMETVRADFDPAEEETMALSVAESTEAQLAEAEVEVLALATTDGLGGRSGSSEVLPSAGPFVDCVLANLSVVSIWRVRHL